MTNPTAAVTAATSMASITWRQGRWMYLRREHITRGLAALPLLSGTPNSWVCAALVPFWALRSPERSTAGAEQRQDAAGQSLGCRQQEAPGIFVPSFQLSPLTLHVGYEVTAWLWVGTPLAGSTEGASQPISVIFATHRLLPDPEHR